MPWIARCSRGADAGHPPDGRLVRGDLVKLAWWDRDENDGRSFPPWRPFMHPQLGPVEIGGIDPRVGIWNPPLHELPRLCATQAAARCHPSKMTTGDWSPWFVACAVQTSAPSSITEQAPQMPCSQPTCVPVRSRSSRSQSTSDRRAGTWADRGLPFTSTETA